MIGYIALVATLASLAFFMYSRHIQNKTIDNLMGQIKHVEWINCRRIEEMVEDTKAFMTDGQTQMVANAFIVAERAAAAETANPSRDSAKRLSNERQLRLEQKLTEPPTKP